ncbi:MAG: hypothetical protein ACOVSW_22090 [Candidatus Kapaibacteriota bacterium]
MATSMFALGCLGLFGLVSCADNVIAPPTEAIVAQKNVKSAAPNIASINSLAANSQSEKPIDVVMSVPVGGVGVQITGYTVDAVNKSVTLFFDVNVNERRYGEGAYVEIVRDVTGDSFSSLGVSLGGFTNGSYSETSPSGLLPGVYTLRLRAVNPIGPGGSQIQVTIPA